MVTENFKKAGEIFQNAIEIDDPTKRAEYLENSCEGDIKLRAEVETLLNAHEQAGDYLEAPDVGANVTIDGPAHIEGPGTKIGRYELLSLIGEGGMGLVYLAQQKEPVKRKVALKIIKPGMDSRQVVARFEAERQALALLDHPNIAHVFDAGTTEAGRPYFVMEYVKGMSITAYCDQRKLNIEQRLRLFEQVCEAIHHAHQKGIIHRDIKPSNILVSVHGDRAVPKIIDFGIAKAITQPLTDKTFVTFQGQILGTPEYMSPEQVDLAVQDIDTRSDIYALGVVLYELLAGVLPFDHESLARLGFAEVQRTIREQEPASPSIRLTKLGEQGKTIAASRSTHVLALARRLHRELEWIPLKAMRKDRCRRYRSASEMADDIRNYLNGLPLIAGPETATYRVKKFVHKHAGSVATVLLVAVAIILGLIISTAMYFRAEQARKNELAARTQSEQAKEQETIARTQAEQAEHATKEKAEELRRTLYTNTIQLADSKYYEGNTGRVRELLESCPQDLRGWEWDRINHILDQSIITFNAHRAGVRSIAVSPDGKRIVTGGWDKAVKIWDIATGKELITLPEAHTDYTSCVAFSPDGKQIVSGDDSGEIKVWDASSGNEVMKLIGHSEGILSTAFSRDGKEIVSAGGDETIKVWDAVTGAEKNTFHYEHLGEVRYAAFSPTGEHIVSTSWGWDAVIKIWDATRGNEVNTIKRINPRIGAVSLSSDGKLLASGSVDNMIKIWDAIKGTEVMTLRGHDGPVSSVAFSRDDKCIVSGSFDCTVRVWDIATGEEMTTLRGNESNVYSVLFTPDGKQIISGSEDGAVKVWDVTVNRELGEFIGHKEGVSSVAFSPDGKRLVSCSADGKVKVWDVASTTEVMTLRGGKIDDTRGLAVFSPDGRQIAMRSEELAIKLWDAETGAEIMTLGGQEESVLSLAFSPDGQRIVSGNSNGEIKLWDVTKGEEIMKWADGSEYWALPVAFSPDGQRIVSVNYNDNIKIWDASSGTELMDLIGDQEYIFSVAFSPDGKRLVTGGEDKTVRVWDASTGMELMTLRGHGDRVFSVAFSPDGKRLVTAGRDGTARVWDSSTGDELLTLRANFAVSCVAFSPDGKAIAGGTAGKTIVLWESTEPSDGYKARKAGITARQLVDELYKKHGIYRKVIEELKSDETIEEPMRKLALQIANSRLWEDEEKTE